MKTIVDLTNCDEWADTLSARCVNRSTLQHLKSFFRVFLQRVLASPDLDLHDRSKLTLEAELDEGVFVNRRESGRLQKGCRLKVTVTDPKGEKLEQTCYLSTTRGDVFWKLHYSNTVRSWAATTQGVKPWTLASSKYLKCTRT